MAKKKRAANKNSVDQPIHQWRWHPYDLQAAGLEIGGVINDWFTSSCDGRRTGALWVWLGREASRIIGKRGYGDVNIYEDFDQSIELLNALTIRGCLQLASQARKLRRDRDAEKFLFQAAILWCTTKHPDTRRLISRSAGLKEGPQATRRAANEIQQKAISAAAAIRATSNLSIKDIADKLAKSGEYDRKARTIESWLNAAFPKNSESSSNPRRLGPTPRKKRS